MATHRRGADARRERLDVRANRHVAPQELPDDALALVANGRDERLALDSVVVLHAHAAPTQRQQKGLRWGPWEAGGRGAAAPRAPATQQHPVIHPAPPSQPRAAAPPATTPTALVRAQHGDGTRAPAFPPTSSSPFLPPYHASHPARRIAGASRQKRQRAPPSHQVGRAASASHVRPAAEVGAGRKVQKERHQLGMAVVRRHRQGQHVHLRSTPSVGAHGWWGGGACGTEPHPPLAARPRMHATSAGTPARQRRLLAPGVRLNAHAQARRLLRSVGATPAIAAPRHGPDRGTGSRSAACDAPRATAVGKKAKGDAGMAEAGWACTSRPDLKSGAGE